jgi:hypothetical protein
MVQAKRWCSTRVELFVGARNPPDGVEARALTDSTSMTMKLHDYCPVALAAFALLTSSVTSAQETRSGASPFALSLDAGTTGVGGSLWITASDRFTITLGYGTLEIDEDFTTDDVDYTGTADLANAHALLNWHPFKGSFHLSGGIVQADDQYTAVATPGPGQTFEFDGVTYPASLVGNLTADAEVADGIAPYAGIGWSTSPRREGFGFFASLGVMFSGSVEVALAADGPLATDPTFQQNLEAERQELQDELNKYEVFPVVRVGVMYRF